VKVLVFAALAATGGAASTPPPDPAARRAAVEKATGEVLADPRYRYCHDDNYPLYVDELGWCKEVPDPSGKCPSLPRTCNGDSSTPAREHRGGYGKPAERPELEGPSWSAPAGLGRLLLWVVIGGALAAIVFAIARSMTLGRGDLDEEQQKKPTPDAPAAETAAARGPIETDVERLLARARAHAERGEFGKALDFLYAALLRRLEGDGLIRVRPWRTNGDYLRELRGRGDLHASVKAIIREIERVQFGAAQASGELYGTLLERVTPLVARALAAIVLGLFVFGASSCTSHPRGAWDDSPSGSHAVLELLGKAGFDARARLKPVDHMGAETDVLVLMPGAKLDGVAWDKLLEWVRAGHTLVVANRSKHLPPALGVDWRDKGAPENEPAEVVPDLVERVGAFKVRVPDRNSLAIAGTAATTLLARGTSTYAAWADVGDGVAITLADEHLFENASLAVADNAQFLVAMLDEYGKRVEFADEATGASSASPAVALSKSKLAPFTLQLGFLLGLFFVYRGAAFGTLRDPPSRSRRAFVDHARALGMQYEKAHATRQVLSLYATWALDRLREAARASGRVGLSHLAEAIARRTGRSLGDVMRVLVEAQDAKKSPTDVRPASAVATLEDLALMREIGQLLKDIGGTREHRRS